ncbi:hypothetical protein C7459_115131 [Tumebacillus permanentifrigoris]|uniref:Uncharacterized protein n=1 Tax=Tumebacillus permanentifrigoris TaxID=378543 RepID=A0A316D6K9_9BACL|nr:hypothetical protein C7459_115131 [Tumebacillus permanentifrigoris]
MCSTAIYLILSFTASTTHVTVIRNFATLDFLTFSATLLRRDSLHNSTSTKKACRSNWPQATIMSNVISYVVQGLTKKLTT